MKNKNVSWNKINQRIKISKIKNRSKINDVMATLIKPSKKMNNKHETTQRVIRPPYATASQYNVARAWDQTAVSWTFSAWSDWSSWCGLTKWLDPTNYFSFVLCKRWSTRSVESVLCIRGISSVNIWTTSAIRVLLPLFLIFSSD